MRKIKLTYDNDIRVSRKTIETRMDDGSVVTKRKTIVTIPCRFKHYRLNGHLSEFGFTTFPEGMRNIMEWYGFRHDQKTGDWVRRVTGVATHVSTTRPDGTTICEDVYDETCGYNIAMMKAKCKAQDKGYKIMCEMAGLFETMAGIFADSAESFDKAYGDESEALERAINTGCRSK
jgi:hypothetical protein